MTITSSDGHSDADEEWMWFYLHNMRSCAEMHEPIELLFGVVSEVGLGIHELDGVHVPQGEVSVSEFVAPIHCIGMAYF